MFADVAGSNFLQGIELVFAAFYLAIAVAALALVWGLVAVLRWWSDVAPSLEDFRTAIQLACQSQNAGQILEGRQRVLSWPRAWVVARMEQVAAATLDWADPWEYCRLLELAALLDAELVQRIVLRRLDGVDAEVREAAQDHRR